MLLTYRVDFSYNEITKNYYGGDNMNKKKIFFTIVAVLILSFSCFAFTACNKTSDIDDFGKQLKDAQSGEIVTSVGFFGVEMTNARKYDGNKM